MQTTPFNETEYFTDIIEPHFKKLIQKYEKEQASLIKSIEDNGAIYALCSAQGVRIAIESEVQANFAQFALTLATGFNKDVFQYIEEINLRLDSILKGGNPLSGLLSSDNYFQLTGYKTVLMMEEEFRVYVVTPIKAIENRNAYNAIRDTPEFLEAAKIATYDNIRAEFKVRKMEKIETLQQEFLTAYQNHLNDTPRERWLEVELFWKNFVGAKTWKFG